MTPYTSTRRHREALINLNPWAANLRGVQASLSQQRLESRAQTLRVILWLPRVGRRGQPDSHGRKRLKSVTGKPFQEMVSLGNLQTSLDPIQAFYTLPMVQIVQAGRPWPQTPPQALLRPAQGISVDPRCLSFRTGRLVAFIWAQAFRRITGYWRLTEVLTGTLWASPRTP